MKNISYKELVERYGRDKAYAILLAAEALARTKEDYFHLDPESRLQWAIDALDEAVTVH